MNIQQALDFADQLKPNMMERQLKLAFLTEVEQLFHREVRMKHEHTEEEEVLPEYTEDTDPGTIMLIPDPYSMLYVYWLLMKIDMQNLESDKWNQDAQRFDQAWGTMEDWYTREHMPVTKQMYYRM